MRILFKLPAFILFIGLTVNQTASAQLDNKSEQTAEIALNIFPNPSRGSFYITVIDDENYQSQLYNMNGKMVRTIRLNTGLNYVSLNEPAGNYILRVSDDDRVQDFRIVLK